MLVCGSAVIRTGSLEITAQHTKKEEQQPPTYKHLENVSHRPSRSSFLCFTFSLCSFAYARSRAVAFLPVPRSLQVLCTLLPFAHLQLQWRRANEGNERL